MHDSIYVYSYITCASIYVCMPLYMPLYMYTRTSDAYRGRPHLHFLLECTPELEVVFNMSVSKLVHQDTYITREIPFYVHRDVLVYAYVRTHALSRELVNNTNTITHADNNTDTNEYYYSC